ncbi:hypothetical protein Tdes44962_MAKER05984 [Teratosphaeria destructans]|uniref:Uncharacterized protein n=1 Tax=Teratosphaeria destructans TaxID=418781 RepID=A0A9W7SIJ8_9PEZI|nr:hypothetical protein Tdes44962_MAKER05984 [Teratosphaeria destructans]
MTVQGMIQHWQSSPHQHGILTGGLARGPFTGAEVELEADTADEEAVRDGILPGFGRGEVALAVCGFAECL